jgi:prepilin-type N-terminal cleavage/methylation domain-containing protein
MSHPMLTLNKTAQTAHLRTAKSEAGFTMLEMVVALLILTIALMGFATAIGYGMMASNRGRQITNTKLLIVSMLEQMETLRNTKQLTYDQISNAATGGVGVFPTTFQPITTDPGPDGIYGTSDDLRDPGADNKYGTSDDFTNPARAPYPDFTRKVIISSLGQNLKKVEVTLQYPDTGGKMQTQVGISYLNNDARSNAIP